MNSSCHWLGLPSVAAAARQQMAPLRRPEDPVWHRDVSTLFPLSACALAPFPPSLSPHLTLAHFLSANSIHLSIFHKHHPCLHQSPRYERYYGAKHGISAPRQIDLRRGAPLRLSADRLDLDDTAGTRALWQRGFKPARRGGPRVCHGKRSRRLPAGLPDGR